MINVNIFENGFSVHGHAEFAEHGKDIVCAATSFLAQTLAKELSSYCLVTSHQESGNMDVKLHTKCDASTVLMEYFENSVNVLAVQYPKNVRIKKKS